MAVTATGLAWGAGVILLFPEADPIHQVFLTLMLAGMSVGSITLLAVDRLSMLGFLVPTLAPLIGRLALEGGEIAFARSVMAALFVLFIPLNASRAGHSLHENLRLRIRAEEQEALLRLSEARLNLAPHQVRP